MLPVVGVPTLNLPVPSIYIPVPVVLVIALAEVPAVIVPLFRELDIINVGVSKVNVCVFTTKLPSVKLSKEIKLLEPPTFQAPSVYQ